MKQIILGIWQNAPIWVWPLFFILVIIGILSMKDRRSSIIPYFFYPLFGLSAANAIASLYHSPEKWVSFSIAYLIGMGLAFRWQDGLITSKSGWFITVKGDRITLLILMSIYFSNFIGGVLSAVAPTTLDYVAYTVIFASIIGLCSGSFTGRAIRVVTKKSFAQTV